MLPNDSPLRRLPIGIDPKQALFLDGIRHAAELADLAHERLRNALTDLALAQVAGKPSGGYTAPFLDAWAIVDSIDRLRGLIKLMPGLTKRPRSDGQPGFHVQTEPIRAVRNVSDHLAQRADYVVARNGTALGLLRWVTLLNEKEFLACAILPGTIVNKEAPLPNPLGRDLLGPTDFITLEAGEHTVCLSDAMRETRRVVTGIEQGFGDWVRANGLEGKHGPADLLVVATMELVD